MGRIIPNNFQNVWYVSPVQKRQRSKRRWTNIRDDLASKVKMNYKSQRHKFALTKFVIELRACTSLLNFCNMTHKESEYSQDNKTPTYIEVHQRRHEVLQSHRMGIQQIP